MRNPKREITPVLFCGVLIVNFIFHFFCHSAGMEKSLVDNKPNDPNAEPCENYENLPFHGLQNPPTKVRQTIFPQILPRRVLVLCKLLALIAVVTFPPLLASTSFTVRRPVRHSLLMLLWLFLSHRWTSVVHSLTTNIFRPTSVWSARCFFHPWSSPSLRLISPDLTLIRLPWLFSVNVSLSCL